jgi:hypothetical protein
MKEASERKLQQIETSCGDVLAQLSGPHLEAKHSQVAEQLGLNQMHLTIVRKPGSALREIPVLDEPPRVSVPLDAVILDKPHASSGHFGEAVSIVTTYSDDCPVKFSRHADQRRGKDRVAILAVLDGLKRMHSG